MNIEVNNLIIKLNEVNHHFNQRNLFHNLNGEMYSNDKIGLIGQNGSGKTTLLKMLIGELIPYTGSVRVFTDSVVYVPQTIDLNNIPEGISLYEYCFYLNSNIYHEYRIMTDFEQGKQSNQHIYLEALGNYHDKLGYDYQNRVKTLLNIAGFNNNHHRQQFKNLSEGQKKLIYIVSMLALEKDLLILDEPTNHVDFELKKKYIKLVRDYEGAVLVVSHDRELLSEACTKIWEIEDQTLEIYNGNWEFYKVEYERRRLEKIKRYQLDSKELARQEDLLERVYKGEAHVLVKAAKSRIERAQKKIPKVIPTMERAQIKSSLKYEGGYSQFMLRLKDVTMSIDGRDVIKHLDLAVQFGEKIAIIGPNGIGKSTLLKVIQGEADYAKYTGEIITGKSAKVGYFSQTLDLQNENRTLLEYIQDLFKCDKTSAYGVLRKYLFTKEQADQKLSGLSGGERNRLQLMSLAEGNYNLLLLDEPTNHLDIHAIETLEELLKEFNGTILLISHDRYFVEAVANAVLDLGEYVN